VQPGLHRFAEGTDEPYGVVWWDPAVLALEQRAPMGVRHESLIGKGASREVVDETLEAFRTWESARASAIAAASRPSLVVTTASEWAAADRALPAGMHLPDVTVHVVGGRQDEERPSGTRFGALVHAVLAAVPLDVSGSALDDAARTHARLLGATAGDAAAAADAARRVLASPWIARAAASSQCRRELPVTLSDGENAIIEGVADLVFEEAGEWVVVEFKTDVEIGRLGLERYRRQVGFYAATIARATGRSASGVLLRI
jgi:ATP-dependent helicase/nuclease subunit A